MLLLAKCAMQANAWWLGDLMPCADLDLQHAWQSYQRSQIFKQQSEKAAALLLTPFKGAITFIMNFFNYLQASLQHLLCILPGR